MRFCPKCGFLLEEKEEGGKRFGVCPMCGFRVELSSADSSGGFTPEELKNEVEQSEGMYRVEEEKIKVRGQVSEDLAKSILEHFPSSIEELEE